MSSSGREERIADYVGEEMDAEDRRRFEAEMVADPSLVEEVAMLVAARDALQRLGGVTHTTHVEPRRRRIGMTLLRYAAVIAIAFVSGYAVAQRSGPPPQPDETHVAVEETDWTDRVAREYGRHAERTGLSRSLIAIAQASRSSPTNGDG